MKQAENKPKHKLKSWRHGFLIFYRGLKYNYPLCCIVRFIRDFDKDNDEVISRRNYAGRNNTRVPCKKCYKKIQVIKYE